MNAKSVCFFLGILLMVSSCTIKEELTLNEDGSGTFSYGFDVSALMKMGKPSDSIKVPKVIDSVFSFKEMMMPMKDSITKLYNIKQEQLKVLEMFRVRLKIDELKKEFDYKMEIDFPKIDSVNNMISPTKAAMLLSLSDKKAPKKALQSNDNDDKNNTSFSYNGKLFVKKVTSETSKTSSHKSKNKKENNAEDGFSKKMEEMFKECKYSLEYHFPKEIKKLSLKNAKISEDKKSFVVEIPIENLKDNQLGFTVEF